MHWKIHAEHHRLHIVLWISRIGALCGVTGWHELARIAEAERPRFETMLRMSDGLPNKEVLLRVDL